KRRRPPAAKLPARDQPERGNLPDAAVEGARRGRDVREAEEDAGEGDRDRADEHGERGATGEHREPHRWTFTAGALVEPRGCSTLSRFACTRPPPPSSPCARAHSSARGGQFSRSEERRGGKGGRSEV